ncbi:hypothetical protein [Flavobacterium sp.]|uniref:hypothetical protein n=1 Tax=Flavobacterium sp. TaxID=239 RepID=UPI00404863A1
MKLESLKETKFKDAVLKKEQMFTLNGGGTQTSGGTGLGKVINGHAVIVDYAYDSDRGNGLITYHGYSNIR